MNKSIHTANNRLNLDDLPSAELKELFYFIHLNSRWLFELLNRLKIGFHIFYDFRYIVYNNKFIEILQYTPKEVEDLHVGDTVFERERKVLKDQLRKLQREQISAMDSRLTIIKGNKEISSVHYFAFITTIKTHPIALGYVLEEKDHDLSDKIKMKMNYSIIIELQCNVVEEILRLNQKDSMLESRNPEYRKDLHLQYGLTKREQEVLQFIYRGYSNQKIANKLFISKRTVEFHRSNLKEKTGAINDIELLHFAIKTNLIDTNHQIDYLSNFRN